MRSLEVHEVLMGQAVQVEPADAAVDVSRPEPALVGQHEALRAHEGQLDVIPVVAVECDRRLGWEGRA